MMTRYGFLVLSAIALGVVGCDRPRELSQSPEDQAGVDRTNVSASQSQASLNQALPPLPNDSGKSKPRLSTNFSGTSTPKADPTDTVANSLKNTNDLNQSIAQGRDNPFTGVNQREVKVTYVGSPAAATPLPQVPQVTAVRIPAIAPIPGPGIAPATGSATNPSARPSETSSGAPSPVNANPVNSSPSITALPTTVGTAPLPVPAVPMVAPPTWNSGSSAAVLAPAAPISPTAIAEAIEIKGLVQVGGQFNLIIRDPDASTSRTVRVGDVIGGGKVRVRRIDAPDSQEPQVVLEQGGVEIRRAIGV